MRMCKSLSAGRIDVVRFTGGRADGRARGKRVSARGWRILACDRRFGSGRSANLLCLRVNAMGAFQGKMAPVGVGLFYLFPGLIILLFRGAAERVGVFGLLWFTS
jgi:hypothetical protein